MIIEVETVPTGVVLANAPDGLYTRLPEATTLYLKVGDTVHAICTSTSPKSTPADRFTMASYRPVISVKATI